MAQSNKDANVKATGSGFESHFNLFKNIQSFHMKKIKVKKHKKGKHKGKGSTKININVYYLTMLSLYSILHQIV